MPLAPARRESSPGDGTGRGIGGWVISLTITGCSPVSVFPREEESLRFARCQTTRSAPRSLALPVRHQTTVLLRKGKESDQPELSRSGSFCLARLLRYLGGGGLSGEPAETSMYSRRDHARGAVPGRSDRDAQAPDQGA